MSLYNNLVFTMSSFVGTELRKIQIAATTITSFCTAVEGKRKRKRKRREREKEKEKERERKREREREKRKSDRPGATCLFTY